MIIAELMQDHHRRCDAGFAAAEDAVRRAEWATGRSLLEAFGRDLEDHFATEEDVLFTAFEQATGMREGPTQMMCYEHGQMRNLLTQMVAAAASEDGDEFAGAAETLLVLMQQHNAKEEHILYPMCDSALSAEADALSEDLRRRLAGGARTT
ncbi:MAG TPA: hemerythrin domain-containing protein [Steroidobacteraceae bacterium]|nr:hemerythrin domain-containing protein [Steroidobacteraceae bacterium]